MDTPDTVPEAEARLAEAAATPLPTDFPDPVDPAPSAGGSDGAEGEVFTFDPEAADPEALLRHEIDSVRGEDPDDDLLHRCHQVEQALTRGGDRAAAVIAAFELGAASSS